MADPQVVRRGGGLGGVQTNSLLSLNYFSFIGNFRKNWSNRTNRTPSANLNPQSKNPGSAPGRCAGWSAPLFFAYGINRFSYDMAQLRYWITCIFKSVFCFSIRVVTSVVYIESEMTFRCSFHLNKLNALILVFCLLFVMSESEVFGASENNLAGAQQKPTKWPVHPVKTQISMGICQLWSESLLSAWRRNGSLATYTSHNKDSSQTEQQPRLIWVFTRAQVILLLLVVLQLSCHVLLNMEHQ